MESSRWRRRIDLKAGWTETKMGVSFEPGRWVRIVVWTGILQAGLTAMSTAWVAMGSWTLSSRVTDPRALQPAAFALLSILIPFIAYAADSRRVLIRYPNRPASAWQVWGGFVSLSLSLAILHTIVLARFVEGDASVDVLLTYRLIVPAFVVGSLGAATGIVVGLLLFWVFDE